ncbi:hypothetical protein DR64_7656 [Paraburkholderia xenovorans LB400]|uniref:Acyl-CoA dehydrogenase n=1 Tax=Paraburkholderia xenovorans (strain LB400) TaxID=266265 RepID=Q13GX0_PARXL|nr:acyl-CoA dehydrogenase family protein [Paraburkholderia xenovorans]ABE36669.1 Putative acyl-CoA dehydrogenase [Paraburkholderia xenovorans LB400]AIP34026.1 hypothetical protein DR64_7656 [Paraburkholderia xenovorans LB400]
MNFSLTDDLLMLRESANAFLGKEVDLAPLLTPGATVAQAGYDRLWSSVTELGWPGMIVPETYGGLGMSMLDLSMIVSECGRFLAPLPLFGTLAGTWAIEVFGSDTQKERWLPEVATGGLKLALALPELDNVCELSGGGMHISETPEGCRLTGTCSFVVDAAAADRIVVVAGRAGQRRCWLVDSTAAGVDIEMLDWRDITRQVCRVHLRGADAEPLASVDRREGDPWPWIRDRLLLVLAAESAGGLHAVMDDTVAYAKERVAFGRPIGAYQAIKHSLADMLAQAECASTAVLYAAWALSEGDEAGPLAVAMAQSYASDAYRDAAFRSIQVFGAIGFTWEMRNHLYFKRARANAELLGSPPQHRERIVRILEERRRDARSDASVLA